MVYRPKLAIITTCTASKRDSAHSINLREIPENLPASQRASNWMELLRRRPLMPKWVEKIYRGDHWCSSEQANKAAKNHFDSSLWVLSAGYGLIPGDQRFLIKPYQATFASESPDYVATGCEKSERGSYESLWWEALRTGTHRDDAYPRTLSALAEEMGGGRMLLIASENYLRLVESELLDAGKILGDGNIVILSAGASSGIRKRLAPYFVQFDSRMGQKLTGALGSLNARVAAWLMNTVNVERFSRDAIDELLQREQDGLEKMRPPVRESMTAEQVRAYLVAQPDFESLSASRLLMRFRREDGKAFEEKHFRRLVAEEKERLQQQCRLPIG